MKKSRDRHKFGNVTFTIYSNTENETIMNVAIRMRKVREVKGWKQSAVASSMQITQQAFSYLEQGSGSPRIDTLSRFCDVMDVQLHFLLSEDVPVTEETVAKYGRKTYSEFISEYAKLEHGVEMFDECISGMSPVFSQLTKAIAI
jgi:transcriptional regulator with XRE-family HTH domain